MTNAMVNTEGILTSGVLTGVKEIDNQLGGGITTGSLTLVEGPSETGKSVICQYLTHNSLSSVKTSIAYYSTDKSVKGLVDQMDSLSMPVLDYLLADQLRIYPLQHSQGMRDSKKNLIQLTNHILRLPKRFNFVIIDSVTSFIHNLPKIFKLDFFYNCREICQQGRTIVIVMNSLAMEHDIMKRVYMLCDDYLKFRQEESANRAMKTLDIPKLHGADHYTKEICFEVKPKEGIHIIPFGKLKCS